MSGIYVLVAVLLMSTVTGPVSGTWRGDEETEDVIKNVRRKAEILCGRRPTRTARSAGTAWFVESADDLDKIAGGGEVRYGDIPWLVNIYDGRFHECGGAIVSEFWVLTAARCVNGQSISSYKIKVGDHYTTRQDEGEQTYRAQQIFLHEAYLYGAKFNIALIKVQPTSDGRGIRFNNYVQPICLPSAGEFPTPGTKVTVSGWGLTSWDDSLPFAPTQTVQAVKEHSFCANSAVDSGKFASGMLCLSAVNGDSDVCLGDQGGPATYQSGDVYILAGIVSSASDCAPPHNPIVLLSAGALRDWIDVTIHFNSNGAEKVIPSRTG